MSSALRALRSLAGSRAARVDDADGHGRAGAVTRRSLARWSLWDNEGVTTDDVPMAALAELLCRQCLDRGRREDDRTARSLLASVAVQGFEPELLVAAYGGVCAAFRPAGGVRAGVARNALDAAYRLLPTPLKDTERLLVAVSLALLAKSGLSERSAADYEIGRAHV